MIIRIRPVQIEDGKNIVKWHNASHVLSHSFNKTPITEESNVIFYKNYIETGKYKQFIVERIDEDFGAFAYDIATVYLKDMDQYNHRCELCIFTSDDGEWNDDAKAQAIKMLLEKAFCEYHMHKVYSYVFAQFLDEAELLKAAGFHAEAILSNEALDANGNYTDVIRFCITKE